jgi:hypothetical protein
MILHKIIDVSWHQSLHVAPPLQPALSVPFSIGRPDRYQMQAPDAKPVLNGVSARYWYPILWLCWWTKDLVDGKQRSVDGTGWPFGRHHGRLQCIIVMLSCFFPSFKFESSISALSYSDAYYRQRKNVCSNIPKGHITLSPMRLRQVLGA